MAKPTVDECLDILSLVWHKAMPAGLAKVIDDMDNDVPGWHTKMISIAKDGKMPPKVVEDMQRLYIYRRCRELLKQAGRI